MYYSFNLISGGKKTVKLFKKGVIITNLNVKHQGHQLISAYSLQICSLLTYKH